MLRFTTLCLCAGLCLAQGSAEKPPAKVDKALRARVNELFQDFVAGKYRQVESLVAQDTKETYYNSPKPKYFGFEVKSIEYSDHFKRAKVTTICQTEIAVVGIAGQIVKIPVGSTWKLEKGQWYWYIDPEDVKKTPFGEMRPGPTNGAPPATASFSIPTTPDFALNKVKVDKSSLSLKAGESGEVTLTNTAQGPMGISLLGQIPGIDVKLDRVNLNAGEKAVLTVQTHPGAHSGTLSIQVEQTNEVIPIQVNIE